MKETTTGIRHFYAAFRYSLSGLRMVLGESAFRQELLLGAINFAAVVWLPLPYSIRLLQVALWGIVLITELLNTAIESVVDLVSPSYHELAKRAKDLASAAVFVSLIVFFSSWGAVGVWITLG